MQEEDNQNPPEEHPELCKAGCGFFASAKFEGFCSKCYKDAHPPKQQESPGGRLPPRARPQIVKPKLSNKQETSNSTIPAQTLSVSPHVNNAQDAPSVSQNTLDSGTAPTVAIIPPPAETPSGIASITSNTFCTTEDASLSLNAAVAPLLSASTGSLETKDETKSPKPSRCDVCKKKIGLTGFSCRCGGQFCSAHRYTDQHKCSYDYHKEGQQQIAKANPPITPDRVRPV